MSEPKLLTEMWAWVVTERDGGEGIPALGLGDGMVYPAIGGDRERVESFRLALIAQTGGLPLKLIRFGAPEVVEVIRPERAPQA